MVKSLLSVPSVIAHCLSFGQNSIFSATKNYLLRHLCNQGKGIVFRSASKSFIYLFFYFPMQIYTAFFLGAVTGVIVNDKTLSSGRLLQMGLRLDLLPAA